MIGVRLVDPEDEPEESARNLCGGVQGEQDRDGDIAFGVGMMARAIATGSTGASENMMATSAMWSGRMAGKRPLVTNTNQSMTLMAMRMMMTCMKMRRSLRPMLRFVPTVMSPADRNSTVSSMIPVKFCWRSVTSRNDMAPRPSCLLPL